MYLISAFALSTVGGSPGLNLLYISIRPSSTELYYLFLMSLESVPSSPNNSIISASRTYILKLLVKLVTGSFLVLSTLT